MSPLLNLISILVVSYSYSLTINSALCSLLYLASIKVLSIKNSVLSVYRLIILKSLLLLSEYKDRSYIITCRRRVIDMSLSCRCRVSD